MALVMSTMPDVWRKVLAEHLEDGTGRCRACRNADGETAAWPCQTFRVAQEAKWVSEGNLPGTGPHGSGGPSATPRLSPLDEPRRAPAGASDGYGDAGLPGSRGQGLGTGSWELPSSSSGGLGSGLGSGSWELPSSSSGGLGSGLGSGSWELPSSSSGGLGSGLGSGSWDLPSSGSGGLGSGSSGSWDLPSSGGGGLGSGLGSGSRDLPGSRGADRFTTGGWDLPGSDIGDLGNGRSWDLDGPMPTDPHADDAATAFGGGQGASGPALASLPPLPPSVAPVRAPEPTFAPTSSSWRDDPLGPGPLGAAPSEAWERDPWADESPSRHSRWSGDEGAGDAAPYGSRVDAPYGSTFGVDDRPRGSRH